MNKISVSVSVFAAAFVAGGLALPVCAATNFWGGAGGDKLWSNAANWTGALPDATNDTVFINDDATGTPGAAGVSNSVVDANTSALTLQFRNTNGFHNAYIASGVTLSVGAGLGAANNVIYVGILNSGASASNHTTISGPGTLSVLNSSNGTIQISQRSASVGSHRATLDLAGLNKFVANISRLAVATDGNSTAGQNYPCGTLLLAKTNDITCSDAGAGNSIIVGLTGQNEGNTSFLRMGQVNLFKADGGMKVGASKSSAILDFNTGLTSPTATFRNKAGTGAMGYWGIADNSALNGSGINQTGLADFTAGSVDAMLGQLFVGRSQNGTTTSFGSSTGKLIFAAGTITATNIVVGSQAGVAGASGDGTLVVNSGGTLQSSGSIQLGVYVGGAGQAKGTLNAGGGSIVVDGSIVDGGGTSAVNLTNAAVTVGGTIGTGASPVDSMNVNNSTLNLYVTGNTNVSVSALTTGGGTNLIKVLQSPIAGSFPAQFVLIKYTGAIGGSGYNFGLGNSTNYPGYLVNNAGNSSVDLVLTAAVSGVALTWVGNVNTNWDLNTTANWKDSDSNAAVFNQIDGTLFDDTASTFSINLVGNLSPSYVTVTNATSNYVFEGTGRITGSAALFKQGDGTLTLANTGNNDFSGPITLDGGTLSINRNDNYTIANVLSGGGHLQKIGGGTTTIAGVSTTFTGPVTIGGGMLQVGAGGITGRVQGNITNLGALVFNRSDSYTYGGSISGTGSVTKQGAGTLTVTGVSTYAGATLIANGVVIAQNNKALGNSSGVTVNNGRTLRLDGGVSISNIPLTLVNTGIDTQGPLQGSNGVNKWAGPVTIGANQVRMGPLAGSTLIIDGVIDSGINNYGLAIRCQDPTATMVLAASNTWLGASSIVVGTVKLANGDNRIPVATSLTMGNAAEVSAAVIDLAGWSQQLAGLISLGNTMPVWVTNTEATAASLTLAFDSSTNFFRGPIGGAISVTKAGTGVQLLSGANTYSGDTTVSAGTLRLGTNNVLPDGTGAGNVVVNGLLGLAGFSDSINGLSGTGLIDNVTAAGPNTLTIGNNSGSGTFNGVIANTAGTLSLVKIGGGTITLGGVNSYGGPTTINGGTLALGASGSINASTGLTIAAGAVLDASGPGVIQLESGEPLSAGRTNAFATDIVGSLSTGGSIDLGGVSKAATLNISGGLALTNSSIVFDLGSTTTAGSGVNDLIAINGALVLAGVSTISPTFYSVPGTGTFTLISGGTSLSGNDTNLSLVWSSNTLRQTAALDTTTTPGSVLLHVAGAPATLVWQGTNSSAWDINTTANWNNLGSPDKFFNYDSVVLNDSSTNGTVDVTASVAPTSAVITNSTQTYVLAGTGKITGNASVTKEGPGVATMNLTNDYTGITYVKGGMLKIGRDEALGATNGGTLVTAGATLDLGSHFINDESVTIIGSGYTNQGALVNNTPSFTANYGLRFLTLAGDAWLGGSGRFDLNNFPKVLGNGYVLNKVGTNMVCFADAVNANFGTINVSNGAIQIQYSTSLGTATNPINVVSPGQLAFYDSSVTNDQPLTFTGGRFWVRSGSASLSGPESIAGSVEVLVDSTALSLYGKISGPGRITKNGTGALNLYGATNTWTGGATLNAGTVNVRATETLVGRVTNNTTLVFLPGTGETFVCSADISGTGTVSQTTAGTTLLRGTNTCEGGTLVSAGMFEVSGLLGGPLTANGSIVQIDAGGIQQAPSLIIADNTHATNIALSGASLSVGNGPTNDFIVARRSAATSIGPRGLFDVSALSSFSANVGNLLVGISTESTTLAPPVGTLRLATNNTITATNIVIGNIEITGGFNTTPNSVTLGAGTNTIQTPVIIVGGLKQPARMTLPTGGTLVLNAGTNATDLSVGVNLINTSAGPDDLLDLSAGTFVASLNQLIIGKKAPGTYIDGGSGFLTAKMVIGSSAANNVTASSVIIGWGQTMTGGGAYGTMVVSGGTFSVSGDVTLSTLIGASFPSEGTLALRGGVFNMAGNIVDGSANASAPSRLILEGGTLDMMPAGDTNGAGVIGSGALPIDTLLLLSGTLQNVGEINGGGTVAKDGPGTLALAGINTYSGLTVVSNGTLLVNGIIAGSVFVESAGTLGGTGTIGGAVANFGTVSPGASIGLLTISNSFGMTSSGVYHMEIGGAGAGGVDYDMLRAFDAATLDGTLRVALTNGFTPAAGNTFTVLTATAISGGFASNDLPALVGATWQITTNAGALLLSVVSSGSPYDSWATLHGLGPSSEAADDDSDGYNNLLEYSQFSDPTNNASKAAMNGGRTNGALQLIFFRNTDASDITYIVEAANSVTNGADWQTINSNFHGLGWSDPARASETGGGNPKSVTVNDPVVGGTNRYLRLRVTKP